MVLAILVLMAAAWPFAAPRLFPAQQLRDTAQSFAADIRVTRLTARMTGTPQNVMVGDTGTAYTTASGTHPLSGSILMRVRATQSSGAQRIQFYPDGSTSGAVVDFALSSHSMTVAVSSLTGRTEITE